MVLKSVTGEKELRGNGIPQKLLDVFRHTLSENFGNHSTLLVCSGDVKTNIRADLLGAVALAANDSGAFAPDWLRGGSPVGITSSCKDDAIFPTAPDEQEGLPDLIGRDEFSFSNYAGLDKDPDAYEELMGFAYKNS